MILTLKHEIFYSYLEMDQDVPKVPETIRDFNKFMATRASHERKVRGSYLRRWLKDWPSQCSYLAQQIWFTKKIKSIFDSAIDRKIKVEKDRKKKRAQESDDDEETDPDEYASVNLSEDEGVNQTQKQNIHEAQIKIAEADEEEEENDGEEDDEDDNG